MVQGVGVGLKCNQILKMSNPLAHVSDNTGSKCKTMFHLKSLRKQESRIFGACYLVFIIILPEGDSSR
jgi:hypothetical protein